MIRPTFSYLGNFTISDTVFRQIIEVVASKQKGMYKVSRTIIRKEGTDEYNSGVRIYLEVVVEFGFNIIDVTNTFKKKVRKELENLTAMNVLDIDILVKNIHIKQ